MLIYKRSSKIRQLVSLLYEIRKINYREFFVTSKIRQYAKFQRVWTKIKISTKIVDRSPVREATFYMLK